MCWMCSNPSMSQADFLDKIGDTIRRCGWAVQYVTPTKLYPSLAYTVGLTPAGLPELVVTGLPYRRAGEVLNQWAAHLLQADPPEPGERRALRDGFTFEVVRLSDPSAHLFVAMAFYGDDIGAQQLVWCDDRGRYPWEIGHRGGRGGQPVLGPRTVRGGTTA